MNISSSVSVIITCYNQGRFLGEAIESALRQTRPPHEIIVVDDGSTDDTAAIASRYRRVKLVQQRNSGLAAARNAGIHASTGDYLVFLDADDRLIPCALDTGINRLRAHTNCAFAYGRYSLITDDGKVIPSTQRTPAQGPPYLRLLISNYIGMHATVMYRREIFASVGEFDTSLAACEDYEMFLRITRHNPIYFHGETVAEYRQHQANMSRSSGLMLHYSLSVLGSQRKYVRGNRQAVEAYSAGIRNWRDCYGKKLFTTVGSQIRQRQWGPAIKGMRILLRYLPGSVANKLGRALIRTTARAPRHFAIKMSR